MYLESIFLDSEVPQLGRCSVACCLICETCLCGCRICSLEELQLVTHELGPVQDISMQLPEQAKQFYT